MKNYKNLYLYKWLAAQIHKFSVKINPENEMRRAYYKIYHRYPDLENPNNLIEKIYWLQLHTDTSMWTKCADKYAMREYVEECGYKEHLPINYGRWENADNIDFETLPNEFVLKSNNGCGTVLVVRSKSELEIKTTRKKMKQWLNVPFGWAGAELHYTRIKPCIIAEELLHQDEDQQPNSQTSLTDYKVWCFSGVPECILVVYGRTQRVNYKLDMYDTNWERIPNSLKENSHYNAEQDLLPKPPCLEQMLLMASKLSKPFPEVRVDFYVVNGKPIIGELTFSSGYGNYSDDFYNYLGRKVDLSNITIIN